MEINPNTFRTNIRSKFADILDDSTKSTNLEKAIFNYALQEASMRKEVKKWENPRFVQLYNDRLWTVFVNLKNPRILESIKTEELLPQTFVFMTHQEMNPKKWKKLIEEKIKRDKNLTEVDLSAATDEFKCYKCKKNICTYYQLQTRSADEPMTTFVTCLNCGNRWKF